MIKQERLSRTLFLERVYRSYAEFREKGWIVMEGQVENDFKPRLCEVFGNRFQWRSKWKLAMQDKVEHDMETGASQGYEGLAVQRFQER